MIFQGEIIVREGNQIDASAMKKLELLGLTNQTTSIFPLIAMVLAVLLQIGVLIYNSLQFQNAGERTKYVLFYVTAMSVSVVLMKFSNSSKQNKLLIFRCFTRGFCSTCFKLFLESKSRDHGWYFPSSIRTFHFYDSIGTNFLTVILMSYVFSGLMATIVRRKRISEQGLFAAMWVIIFPVMMDVILIIYQGMSFGDATTWLTLVCGFTGALFSFLLTIGLHPILN